MSPSRYKKQDPSPKKKQEEEEPREKKLVRLFLQSPEAPPLNRIEVDISSLKKSLTVKEASDALSEIQTLLKHDGVASTSDDLANPTWNFWSCCLCEDLFPDIRSYLVHVLDSHMGPFPECIENLAVFPEEWKKKLKEACWKPIDVDAAALQSNGIAESKDEVRTSCLEKIGKIFEELVEKDMLDITHLNSLLGYAMAKVRKLRSAEFLMNRVGCDSTLCFRCLNDRQLKIVLRFLSTLRKQCEILPDDESDSPGEELLWAVNLDRSFSRVFLIASHPLGVEEVVAWLYGGCSFRRSLKSWTESRKARRDEGVEIVKSLNQKLDCSRNDYDLIQSKGRSHDAYNDLCEKCTRVFMGKENDSPILGAFLNELEEHPTETYTVLRRIEEMKSAERQAGLASEHVDTVEDQRIIYALLQLKGWLQFENHMLTANIKKSRVMCQQLISSLGTASGFNHLTILVPILKCFLKNQWEEKAEKEEKARKEEGFLKKEQKANLDEIDALVKHIEKKS